jgi:hypothetical protein
VLAAKDARLATEAAKSGASDLPLATTVHDLYQAAAEAGMDDEDIVRSPGFTGSDAAGPDPGPFFSQARWWRPDRFLQPLPGASCAGRGPRASPRRRRFRALA